jgi:hypothetical protein
VHQFVKIIDDMLVLSNSAGLVCISLREIRMTDLSNEMLSMNHVKFKLKITLKFAAATQVTKRITEFFQKPVMIYLDGSQYFDL